MTSNAIKPGAGECDPPFIPVRTEPCKVKLPLGFITTATKPSPENVGHTYRCSVVGRYGDDNVKIVELDENPPNF